jgi:hypothetical protein
VAISSRTISPYKEKFPANMLASVGYVVDACGAPANFREPKLRSARGGTASQPLAWIPDYSAGITALLPWGADKYNSLQATLNRRFSQGLQFQAAYTYSKDIGMSTSILIPQYINRDYYTTGADRTHHFVISASYELPFGKGKPLATRGVGNAVLSGWSLNGIFNHYSGAPFTVSCQRIFLQLHR